MKVLVCGGRGYTDRTRLYNELDAHHAGTPITLIIHGAAPGADSLAGDWAQSRHIIQSPFPADWKRHGKGAGHIRNKRMLDEGQPDLIIAFPGGRGTANMINQAQAAGIPVEVLKNEA